MNNDDTTMVKVNNYYFDQEKQNLVRVSREFESLKVELPESC